MVEIFLLFVMGSTSVTRTGVSLRIGNCVAYCLCRYIYMSPFHICHFLCFCPLDEFGVRAKQLEHEGPTHPVPLTERKELTVSNDQE